MPTSTKTPDYMLGAVPVAGDETPDTSYMQGAVADGPDSVLIAHGAAQIPPAQAAKTLRLSRATGLAPTYVSGDMAAGLDETAKKEMAEGLNANPTLLRWAAQSPVHAAAIKQDVTPLNRLSRWLGAIDDGTPLYKGILQGLNDIAGAEAMREYMSGSGPAASTALDFEDEAREYDAKDHGLFQNVARALPQMALYSGVGYLSGSAGVAPLMYAQNKGTLARMIQQAQPLPPEVKSHTRNVGGKLTTFIDNQDELDAYNPLTKDEINKYATIGSAASAITLAGLMGPLLRSIPGSQQAMQGVVGRMLSVATTRTVGAAAIKTILTWGQHSGMGALGMALQGAINSSVVQQATKDGQVDYSQIAREAMDTFLKVLPVMAVFGAYGPARDYLTQRGRINLAAGDGAKLDAMVAQAKEVQLVRHAPDYAAELFGQLGQGARAYIGHKAASALEGLNPARVAEAQASEGDVSVPLGDYLAHFSEDHEAIRDDVKLTRDGMNMGEAREEHDRLTEALSPDEARKLYGRMSPDELQGLEVPIAADLTDKQKEFFMQNIRQPGMEKTANNRGPGGPVPKTEVHVEPGDQTSKFKVPGDGANTAKTPPLHEVMAQEYGGTPEEWAKRLTPELLEALNEEGSVGAQSAEEHAARVIEALPIDDIEPKQFQRKADKLNKYIQAAAEKARTGGPAGAKRSSLADVVELSTRELARDVNAAKAKKAAAVQDEMGKLVEKIGKQAADQKLRATLFRAGSPLLHLFDAIAEGTGISGTRQGWADAHNEAVANGKAPFSPEAQDFANARMKGAMKEAREWLDQTAWPTGFDEAAIQRFLDKPQPSGELTPPQLRNLADATATIVKAAKEQAIMRLDDRNQQVADVREQVQGELQQNASKGLPELTGSEHPGWWERRKLDANAAQAVMLRAKQNFIQKSATLAKVIFDRFQQASFDRNDMSRDTLDFYKQAFENMPKEIAARRYEVYDLSSKLPSPAGVAPATSLTREWVWKLARHWGSQGNIDRVASTHGWSKDVLSSILFDDPQTKLSIPEWDYLQSMGDHNEQYVWPRIKEHFEKYYGQAPPKVAAVPFKVQAEDGAWKNYAGGYEPLKMDKRPGVAPQAEPTKGIASFFGNDFQAPWTPGQVKSRLNNSHYLVNMDWDTGRATMAATLHWLAFDQPVRDVAKFLNDAGLQSDMHEFMGAARADQVPNYVKAVATRNADSLAAGSDIIKKGLGVSRGLAVMGAVGASARLAVAQLGHPALLMAGGEINPLHGIPALVSIFKPFEMENGEVRLMPNWRDAIESSRYVQDRADNAYRSLQQGMLEIGQSGKKGPLGKAWAMGKATAGLYLHAVDRLTTTWAWVSCHNEAVAKGMEPFSPEAIKFADSKVFDVMPEHSIEGAAPMLSNRQLGGFIIMHGFKNTLYNLRSAAVARSMQDFHQADTGGQYVGASAKTAGRIALQTAMFSTAAILGKLALGYGQQPGEDKKTWLLRDAMAGQTSDIPIFGELGEPLAKALVNKLPESWGFHGRKPSRRDFTMHNAPAMAAANKAYDMLGDIFAGTETVDKKVFNALEGVMYLSGVPSKPVRTSAEFLYKKMFGEEYDGGDAASVGRFFYNEAQWNSIKRSLDPGED